MKKEVALSYETYVSTCCVDTQKTDETRGLHNMHRRTQELCVFCSFEVLCFPTQVTVGISASVFEKNP